MRNLNLRAIAGIAAAAAILACPQAKATLTFDLANGNAALAGLTTPFGKVEVTRVDINNATVTLTAFGLYSFGDGTTLGLNLNGGGTFSISSLSGATLGQGAAVIDSYSLPGAANVSEFGDFNFTLQTFDGFQYSTTYLEFNLHTSSSAWMTESDILVENADGFEAVGHVFVRNSDGSDRNLTGFAAVPEPTTVIAGALLLLPFGASTIRILRKHRTA